jgi:hypothetical protein
MGSVNDLVATQSLCGERPGDVCVKSRALAGIGLATVIAFAASSALTNANEIDYIDLFGGAWSGSGTVLNDAVPWQVSCHAKGRPSTNHLTIEGSCNVAIISVRIAADISYDPASGRYSGTYIGAKVGPAHVSGKRNGSVVNLVITWPKPVNGDTKARMTIMNSGSGNLRIVVSDNLKPGGPEQQTSDVSLTQS